MTRLATTATTTILAAAIVLATADIAGACPNCKGTIENTAATAAGPSAQPALPAAFNTSIYYMLGGLFAVLGTGGYLVARTIRQTDAAAMRRGFPVEPPDEK